MQPGKQRIAEYGERGVMTNSAKSVFFFGVYLAIAGATLVLIPDLVLQMLGLPAPTEGWIRVVGVLTMVIASFCMQAGRANLTPFFQWTVYSRCFVFLCFLGLVLFRLVPPIVLVFGIVDLAGASWTAWTLRASQRQVVPSEPSAARSE